jgi:hypothetical protein
MDEEDTMVLTAEDMNKILKEVQEEEKQEDEDGDEASD